MLIISVRDFGVIRNLVPFSARFVNFGRVISARYLCIRLFPFFDLSVSGVEFSLCFFVDYNDFDVLPPIVTPIRFTDNSTDVRELAIVTVRVCFVRFIVLFRHVDNGTTLEGVSHTIQRLARDKHRTLSGILIGNYAGFNVSQFVKLRFSHLC